MEHLEQRGHTERAHATHKYQFLAIRLHIYAEIVHHFPSLTTGIRNPRAKPSFILKPHYPSLESSNVFVIQRTNNTQLPLHTLRESQPYADAGEQIANLHKTLHLRVVLLYLLLQPPLQPLLQPLPRPLPRLLRKFGFVYDFYENAVHSALNTLGLDLGR
ncbi:uncharacterized protein EI90DRAFT_3051757 [Cantharellus anzutake]|uniref:uncharacterized protein n=1 Tax=Cantharellus anzutake TaxID=1750568 RepID=UPI00190771EB|nr:uncharacterized protein EI90DRAFT_3051757 [Cantharellus anzutake]KAF8334304.1 hypothetical protein EI90DRAFT_3051757 [Cantharellus anzutake]